MPDPNVLLVVLDCVRARNTSLHGYRRKTTPKLESFAERANTYTQARAPAGWSLPSHASLLTGFSPAAHRMQITDRLLDDTTVFDTLAMDGYETAVFTENPYLTVHPSNLNAAFDRVVTERPSETEDVTAEETRNAVDGFWYADQFGDWVAEQDGPWGACVNLMDAHMPYDTRAEYDEWEDSLATAIHDELPLKWRWAVYGGTAPPSLVGPLERLYDGAIRQADAAFGRVIEWLEASGELENTFVVVTADHGEGFGEPAALDGEPDPLLHGMGCHEVLYHVPLLAKAPGQTVGKRIETLADISRFPAAVDTVRDGDSGAELFTPENGRVVAFQAAANGQEASKAEQFTDTPQMYLQELAIVYTDAPEGGINKYAAWGEQTYVAHISHTTPEPTDVDPSAISPEPPMAVADEIAAAATESVVEPMSPEEASLDEYETDDELESIDIEQRLRDLGYL